MKTICEKCERLETKRGINQCGKCLRWFCPHTWSGADLCSDCTLLFAQLVASKS